MSQQQMPKEPLLKGCRDSDYTAEQQKFMDDALINLQGKNYLPVNVRVKIMRALNPNLQLVNEVQYNAEGQPVAVKCTAAFAGYTLAQAHKTVSPFKKGAMDFGIEKAETGAMGRVLNMLGCGTMTGDLFEEPGEQIAEAPVAKSNKSVAKSVAKSIKR